jgi:hypothetical protein
MTWKWYITVAAVGQWMRITGRRGELEDTNPDFVDAQNELGEFSLTAKLASTPPSRSGALTYRCYWAGRTKHGKRRRVECQVMPAGRVDGDLPQLVRVKLK